jgi:hypothetical protein
MPVAEKRETPLEGLLEEWERIVAALAPCDGAARCLASYRAGESLGRRDGGDTKGEF